MKKLFLQLISIIAFIVVAIGLLQAFGIKVIPVKDGNEGFVSAFFSLAGVLIYFIALMYQIKEYKLQVEELKKSVEAQTKSSEALNDQKKIFLTQNTNSLVVGLINGFAEYIIRNDIEIKLEPEFNILRSIFSKKLSNYYIQSGATFDDDFYNEYANDCQQIVADVYHSSKSIHLIKRIVVLANNVLYYIEKNKETIDSSYFNVLFFSQLTTKESSIIYLSTLMGFGFTTHDDLKWNSHIT